MNKELEITIRIQDESILDLDGDEATRKLDDIQREFENSPIGICMIGEGFERIDHDIDDMEMSITYRKE